MNRRRSLLVLIAAASCGEGATIPFDATHLPDAPGDGGANTLLCADWGVDGYLQISPPISAGDILLENDGRIVLAGHRAQIPTITRVDPTGAIDTTFGEAGDFAMPVPGAEAGYRAIARRASGGYVAVGLADDANGVPDLLIDMVTATGQSDLSSCDGRSIKSYVGSNLANAVSAVNDGFIVAMATMSAGIQTTELFRFDDTCSPDSAYGDAGRAIVDAQFVGAIFAADGTGFVLGDVDTASGNYQLFVVDPAGVVTPAIELAGGGVPHMAWDGADLVIGLALRPTVTQMTFLKVDATGTPVTSFGDDGFLTVTPLDAEVTAMAVDADGRLLIASGFADVERFLPGGQVDPTFGEDGTLHLEVGLQSVGALTLMPDQRIIATTSRSPLVCIQP